MGNVQNWKCSYCGKFSAITSERITNNRFSFDDGNKFGNVGIWTTVVTCANPDCREPEITTTLAPWKHGPLGEPIMGKSIQKWKLRPAHKALAVPDYVPRAISESYTEACAIVSLSPKASATLSRRALQGMIRDFWGIKKPNLLLEIDALKDQLDDLTWKAIHGLRSCGNIGAHMEKDINIIIEVEPNEAESLISLVEMLIEEWYVARYHREQKLLRIVAISSEKDARRADRSEASI